VPGNRAFCAGGLSHVIADALTIQGVPLGWWSDRRFHLFGGRLRTGQMGEYWVAGAFVLACIGFAAVTRNFGDSEYSPFFWDYADYYHQGLN
jgi:inner membrane protein